MRISIAGSDSHHNIYQQASSAPNKPAIAQFYPQYPYGSAPALVGAGAAYTIHSQMELTAKEDICAGTQVSITIPRGSGMTTPVSGVAKDTKITLSQVETGHAIVAIGTPDMILSRGDQFAGLSGRSIQVTLDNSRRADYSGLPWAPIRTIATNFVYLDGFRTISGSDRLQNTVTLFSGYGSIKRTSIKDDAAFAIKGARLDHSKNINANPQDRDQDIWLTVSKTSNQNVGAIRPVLKKGSYLQLDEEILRFTGEQASGVKDITLPQTVGVGCRLNGANCGAGQNCATVTFSGCSDNPSVSVIFTGGAITSFSTLYRGACMDEERAKLTGTLVLSAGTTCTISPACGTGCKFFQAWAFNDVIKVKRGQFSTALADLTCHAEQPCTHWLLPGTVYLENGGLNALQYTSSANELNLANGQSVKIGYSDIADTVVAGDHVTSIRLPQTVGTNCQKEVVPGVTQLCTDGMLCAKVSFSGCSVNPEASLTFGDGAITAVVLSGADDRHGQSVCHFGQTLVGSIVLEDDVQCDVVPACGIGCIGVPDTDKDTLIIKYRTTWTDQAHTSGVDVVRVHSAQRIGYQVALVPPTVCTILQDPQSLLPGQCASDPKAGNVFSWIDPMTGGILASMYATEDGLKSLCLDFESGGPGKYPSACTTSCENRTTDGGLIASQPLNITLEFSPDLDNSTNLTVAMSMPITFNTAYNASARRNAPQGYEYRLNGDCRCPSSKGSMVNCNISTSGIYQAHLIEVGKCKSLELQSNNMLLIGILVGVASLFVLLLSCYFYDKSCRTSSDAKDADGESKARDLEADNSYEGPVFVGRPVPLTPTMPPYSVMPAANVSPVPINSPLQPWNSNAHLNRGASPVLMPEAAMWNHSNSFHISSLPATLTPAARPGRSPVFNMSAGMPRRGDRSGSPARRQEDGELRPSPSHQSVSSEGRAARPSRMPYGV